ncbi:MAG: hypothetical protein N2053_09975 [Chitinispirillaceae bacterium]|nr:hypothetical protein [Chitinispirillaceae bacterium]
MMFLRLLKISFSLILCGASCIIESPPTFKVSKPTLIFNNLSFVKEAGEYYEAIHLSWQLNNKDEKEYISSFILLRKFSEDSTFDIFPGSRAIPPDTFYFYDKLIGYRFPENGYDSVCYRIFTIDKYGNSGDTSDVCIVYIAPQPELKEYDKEQGCIKWESWIRGGIRSWCNIWNEDKNIEVKSKEMELFPFTDKAALFEFCLPDSLRPLSSGKWFYSIFVKASERYSIKVGFFDVP